MKGRLARALPMTLLAFSLWTPAASGTYVPLGSGNVKLALDKSFLAFLEANGIELSASNGASRRGPVFSLPVIAGNLDPALGKGEIDAAGTLFFSGQRKKVPLRGIAVKTKHSPLVAKVGGSQLKVATSRRLDSKREGFGAAFAANELLLSAKAATRLNKKLRPRAPFYAGQPLGTLSADAQPKLVAIEETGGATLAFDPAFLAKLASRFVSLNPIFPAEHQGATFSFPILTGSQLAPDGSQGSLRTGGSLELLQLGAGQIIWHEFWLEPQTRSDSAEADVEPTPAFPGKVGRVGVFGASLGSVSADPKARTISASGIALTLSAQAAKSLNEAFAEGKEAFGAGEAVGTLSFAALGE